MHQMNGDERRVHIAWLRTATSTVGDTHAMVASTMTVPQMVYVGDAVHANYYDEEHCEYCKQVFVADRRGGCSACGAPKSEHP